jgi:lysozyme family protein
MSFDKEIFDRYANHDTDTSKLTFTERKHKALNTIQLKTSITANVISDLKKEYLKILDIKDLDQRRAEIMARLTKLIKKSFVLQTHMTKILKMNKVPVLVSKATHRTESSFDPHAH